MVKISSWHSFNPRRFLFRFIYTRLGAKFSLRRIFHPHYLNTSTPCARDLQSGKFLYSYIAHFLRWLMTTLEDIQNNSGFNFSFIINVKRNFSLNLFRQFTELHTNRS